MNDKINKSVEPFQEFLNNNFKQCSKESIEVLLMLAYGQMFDIYSLLTNSFRLSTLTKTKSMMLSTHGVFIISGNCFSLLDSLKQKN